MAIAQVTKADLANAQRGLYEVSLAEQWRDKCRACGLDTAEADLRCQTMRDFFQAFLQAFQSQPPTHPTS